MSSYSLGRFVEQDGQRFIEKPWYIDSSQIGRFQKHLEYVDAFREGGGAARFPVADQNDAVDNALMLCRLNPAFMAHEYMNIRLGKSGEGRFNSWYPGQRKVYAAVNRQRALKRPVRLIILKSRRQGVSTLCQALNLWRTNFHKHAYGMISAHEDRAAKMLFEMYNFGFDSLPAQFQSRIRNRNNSEIIYQTEDAGGRCSHMTVAPGGGTKENAGKGRGQAVHFWHCSEAAYWDEPETYWDGARPSVEDYPETYIMVESTANGFGWFQERWDAAAKGWDLVKNEVSGINEWQCLDANAAESDLVPVFLSWLEDPKHNAPFETPQDRDRYMKHLDDDESVLAETFGATPEQLLWRKRRIGSLSGGVKKFNQEYPTTPHEAFITSGKKVFDPNALRFAEMQIRNSDCYPKRYRAELDREDGAPKLHEDPDGPVWIYRPPTDEATYSVGIDASYGKPNGDFSCAQVLNNRTWEQAAIIHGRIEDDDMGEVCVAVCRHYNEALAIVETNGPGLAVQKAMERLEYWNFYARTVPDDISGKPKKSFGWWSSGKTRFLWVSDLKANIRKLPSGEGVILNHLPTVHEMRKWVRKRSASGKVKEQPTSSSGYDDQISALGITITGGCIENGEGAPIISKEVGAPAPDRRQIDPMVATLGTGRQSHNEQCHPQLGANW